MLVVLLLLSTIFLAINSGSINVSVSELLTGLFAHNSETVNMIIEVRFPRIVISLLVGAALGVSGLLLQTSLKNPLLDPSIVGVSSGAHLFVFLGIVLFPQFMSMKYIFAIIGGIVGYLLIMLFVGRVKSNVTIILIGIAISAFFRGIVSAIQFLQGAIPGTSNAVTLGMKSWGDARVLLYTVPLLLLFSLLLAKMCNIFVLDDQVISSLGVNLKLMRNLVALTAVILAAVSTAIAGVVAFLALIIPHIAKLLIGKNHIYTIPFTALLGSLVFLAFDTLGRVAFDPVEIPADIIMMIVGAPVFLFLIKKGVRY